MVRVTGLVVPGKAGLAVTKAGNPEAWTVTVSPSGSLKLTVIIEAAAGF